MMKKSVRKLQNNNETDEVFLNPTSKIQLVFTITILPNETIAAS